MNVGMGYSIAYEIQDKEVHLAKKSCRWIFEQNLFAHGQWIAKVEHLAWVLV